MASKTLKETTHQLRGRLEKEGDAKIKKEEEERSKKQKEERRERRERLLERRERLQSEKKTRKEKPKAKSPTMDKKFEQKRSDKSGSPPAPASESGKEYATPKSPSLVGTNRSVPPMPVSLLTKHLTGERALALPTSVERPLFPQAVSDSDTKAASQGAATAQEEIGGRPLSFTAASDVDAERSTAARPELKDGTRPANTFVSSGLSPAVGKRDEERE